MEILETSKVGDSVLSNKGSIIIGLSIKNSYFKDENLKKIINWASTSSSHSYIMIPDNPAIYTLMSLGYEPNKAKAKAILEANRLENKCKRIIEESSVANISIVRWKDIEENEEYIESLDKIKSLYESDSSFKKDVQDTTTEVISFNGGVLEIDKALEIGVSFVFQELAFISNGANILKQTEIAYFYHKTMLTLKSLIEGKYKLSISTNVGYITAA